MAGNSGYLYDGCSYLDPSYANSYLSGPVYDRSSFGVVDQNVFGSSSKRTGKWKFEFNFRFGDFITVGEVYYRLGLVSDTHDRSQLLGNTSQSWAFDNQTIEFVHSSTAVAAGGTFSAASSSSSCGVYIGFHASSPSRGGVLLVAVDFDAGKIWMGWGASFSTESYSRAGYAASSAWDGDPASGTGETFTFTPNTPLTPAASIMFRDAVTNSTGILCLATDPGQQFYGYPTGFSCWDQPYHIQEMLADEPYGLWLAAGHKGALTNNIGMVTSTLCNADSSGNLRFVRYYDSAQGYLYAEYAMYLAQGMGEFFAAQPDFGFGPDPTWLDDSFADCAQPYNTTYTELSLEVTLLVTGAGATNGGSGDWTEGSGIIGLQTDEAISTLFGLSLRDRRLVFGFDGVSVTHGSDVDNGVHHVIAVYSGSNYIRIFLDGQQVGETTSSVPASAIMSYLGSGIILGSIQPATTNGRFPGLLRDVAVYKTALSPTRVAAHYAHLQTTSNPIKARQVFERNEAVTPFFIT